MSRRVREFFDIEDHVSLDDLIGRLVALRDSFAEDAEAELRLRGDDVFGRRITIAYFRPQTSEEAAVEERYADAAKAARLRELDRLQRELGVANDVRGSRKKLRMVA